ncbi:Acyl-CoA dehydrogenase [Paraburkholderia piptadeniae]|uniref:Acyl-CoA dehydrogenase n=1 Tax=Paraburkholderia piptadeniae TaxID=1701573 RepID=A0A1N7SR36_9BURK|nr:MaoC family dehydratase N-terminal domain-containing protein [Paraburkholderia piptadeniae]SIT49397.1 Acyl-CoA dehydrogenase [Paraburkholderia piptadeniae]
MNSRSDAVQERTETATDFVAFTHAAGLSATLDYATPPRDGDTLPPLWHWIFFRPLTAQSLIAEDGHPRKGDFLPELGLPRRMWAGGRLRFISPIVVGKPVSRESRILDVTEKQGRTGRLGFVTVRHHISCDGVPAIEEEHDIVYREPATPGAPAPAPTAAPEEAEWQRTVVPDEVLLFRYSALTFNGHRIHYDKPYVTGVEGYPGLVVHGPLIATLLLDLVRRQRPDGRIAEFAFKAMRPCFAGNSLHLCGKPSADGKTVELWSKDHEGWIGMTARATLA